MHKKRDVILDQNLLPNQTANLKMIISQEQKEFFIACKKNDVTNFKKLIQNKNVSVRAADSKGMSCLNLACSKENEEIISTLKWLLIYKIFNI